MEAYILALYYETIGIIIGAFCTYKILQYKAALKDEESTDTNKRPDKIYGFTYVDTQNSTMLKILHNISDAMTNEAHNQSWKEGYKVLMSLPIDKKGNECRYHFEVYGEFTERDNYMEVNKFYRHKTMVDVFFEVLRVHSNEDGLSLEVAWWSVNHFNTFDPRPMHLGSQDIVIPEHKIKEYSEVVVFNVKDL